MAFSFQEALSFRRERFLHAESGLDHALNMELTLLTCTANWRLDCTEALTNELTLILCLSNLTMEEKRNISGLAEGFSQIYVFSLLDYFVSWSSWLLPPLYRGLTLESMTGAFINLWTFPTRRLEVYLYIPRLIFCSGTNAQMPAGQWTFPRCCCLCSSWFPFILCRTSDPRWTFHFIDQHAINWLLLFSQMEIFTDLNQVFLKLYATLFFFLV